MKLFLDDERFPASHERLEWIVVRTVDEFFSVIDAYGADDPIEVMSLDHDLANDEPTGFEAVKRLVEGAMDDPVRYAALVEIVFHTANPVGLDNMEGYLRSAQRNGILEGVRLVRRSVLNHPIK